jgi:DNA-directed RNA polymerase specialized sigma24 family protein
VRRQRRRVREVHDVADTLLAHDADSLERLIRNEERTCVRQALRALAAGDQQLLRRCFIQGTLIADLARESGVPASRLRKRKSRAVRRLRLLLAPRLELVTTRIRHRV